MEKTFEQLGLEERVLERARAAQYLRPTPIQSVFIPAVLSGRDVLGQARTGTGKTAAYLLPMFQRLPPRSGNPTGLILAPTRELALQIHAEVGRLGAGLGFTSGILYGGASYGPQLEALAAGVDLLVATPGRLMDHMRSRRLNLSSMRVVVLDEADRMLDLGFRKDIEYILRHCPTERQTLLLSATIPPDILHLGRRFMRDPVELWVSQDKPTVEQIKQAYCIVERDQKLPLLLKILDDERPGLAIIFCGTKLCARKLAARLKDLHLRAREIHGDLTQAERERIMGRFRRGKVHLLVATDVASRGIDVDDITHIINYDIPYRPEDYVHRIGRTARMDKAGKAFTFVSLEEAPELTAIEMFINMEITRVQYASLESCFWPHPPAVLPPEFLDDEPETEPPPTISPRDSARRGGRGGPGGRGGSGGRGGGGRRRK